jgi:hypothetical protein
MIVLPAKIILFYHVQQLNVAVIARYQLIILYELTHISWHVTDNRYMP